jgi:hypothetical protein
LSVEECCLKPGRQEDLVPLMLSLPNSKLLAGVCGAMMTLSAMTSSVCLCQIKDRVRVNTRRDREKLVPKDMYDLIVLTATPLLAEGCKGADTSGRGRSA